MSGSELRDVLASSEFTHGLEEMSSYLASIMQERPIVHLLAKCLWKLKHKFALEDKKRDLLINDKRIEFKFNYNRCEVALMEDLLRYGDHLTGMWELVQAGKIKKSWCVLARIYEDICVRKPDVDVFVWVICARDLRGLAKEDLRRVPVWRQQRSYDNANPYSPGGNLPVVDECLLLLKTLRPFTVLKHHVVTNGDFPSTYHFRICDFGADSGH